MDSDPISTPASSAQAYDALGEAKRLLRTIRAGALATLAASGHPFGTLVNVATDIDGSPVLLLSRLALHTGNLARDPRCSLLLAQGGKGDPLAHPRLTVVGAARLTDEARVRDRFLRRHPKAALYAGFPDFAAWRLEVDSAHLNGGFARAADFSAAEVLTSRAGADALADAETAALDHLNQDHADALRLYAAASGADGDAPWRATGLDPDGLDLTAGDRTARLVFPEPVRDGGALRRTLVALVARARDVNPEA